MVEKISFEDFSNATFNSIMRAIEAHKQLDSPLIKNPVITVGIIWSPQIGAELPGVGKSTKG
ncbi:MAG: hypothetical protein OJF51_004349 [Nitrospira sp.]|nr:MAG: hypothetical protein OJF51_004349 [Nitrospira sp.]